MDIYIKNPHATNVINYQGQDIDPLEYFLIPTTKLHLWQADSSLLADIATTTAIVAKDNSGNNDIADLSEAINYLKQLTVIEVDSEGRQISRVAAGKKGWTYLAHPIEMITSTLNSTYSQDYLGNVRTDLEIQFFDSSDTELTTQAQLDVDCTKTVITFKPEYDFEVIAGTIHQCEDPVDDVRLWVIGGAFVKASNTPVSVKEFATGINMRHIGAEGNMETDGRASKMMLKDLTAYGLPYPTYQGNCFQMIVRHPAGKKHEIMVIFEYYRA